MSISSKNTLQLLNNHNLSTESIFFCEFPDYNSNLNPFNYLPLLIRHPVKPINNLIYLFVCDRNFPLDLFALGRRWKGVFLFVQVEYPVNEEDQLVVDGFFGGVVEVNRPDGKLLKIHWFILKKPPCFVEEIECIIKLETFEFNIPRRYRSSVAMIVVLSLE